MGQQIDRDTEEAVQRFLALLRDRYSMAGAIVYGIAPALKAAQMFTDGFIDPRDSIAEAEAQID